jgi:hypothetical protein
MAEFSTPFHDEEKQDDFLERWMEKSMLQRINEFTIGRKLNLLAGTFNVCNSMLDPEGLDAWLCEGTKVQDAKTKEISLPPDIVVVGFQEIVDLNTMNVVLDGYKTAERADYFRGAIESSLEKISEHVSYVEICSETMVGLALFVYANQAIIGEIRDIRSSCAPSGVLGVMGNKGGVAIRFNLFDTTIAIVCAHLSSGDEKVEARNNDYAEINRKLIFRTSKAYDYSSHLKDSPHEPSGKMWRRTGIV